MARDLKLQVVLDAVNRATRPLKKITEGSEGTARALRESREQLKTLERAQKDMRGFRDLKQQSDKTSRALGEQQQEIRDLTRQMNSAEGATGDLARKRAQAIRQAKKLKDRYRDEQRQLHELRGSMTRVEGVTGSYSDQQRQLAERVRKANQQIHEQKQRLSEAARQQRRAADAANRYHRSIGRANNLTGAGFTGVATGGAALYGGARMLAPGVSYGESMSRVQALTRLEKNDPRMQALRDQARELGSTTSFSATQAADAQGFLAMAGFDPDAIRAAMPDMLNLAKANKTDLARTADIGSNILSGFGLDPSEMGRVGDILTATTTRANVDLQMLGESMKYVAPQARAMGLSLEEASAMAGLLGNVGIQGSQAGTTLRAMMTRLAAPTGNAAGALKTLGVNAKDSEGNLRNVPRILADVAKATEKMGNAQRAGYLKAIFGEEPGAGMAELIAQQGSAGVEQFTKILTQAGGENARVAKVMADNIGGDLKSLNSAWEEIGITLTDTNEGPLRDLIQNVTAITRAVGDWMKQNPELTAQLATAAASLAAMVAVGGALTLSLASVLGPVAAVRYGMELFGLKTEGAGKKAKKVSKGGIKALGGALKWLGRLIAWVGRAFLLNPIGLVVTAIAGAAYLIYRNWDRVGPWFADLWQGIKAKASTLWQWLKNIAPAVGDAIKGYFMNWTLPGLLIQHWDAIKATAGKLWRWFKDAPRNAIDAVARMIRDWDLKGILKEKWAAAIDYIKSLPSRMKAAGADLARGLRDGIKDKAGDAWRAMTETAAGTEESARQRLQTRSPSRVFMAIGRDTMTGLQHGIASSEQGPLGQVSQFSKRLRQAGAGITVGTLSLPAVAAPEIPEPIIPTIGKPAFTVPDMPVLQGLAELQLTLSELPDMERRLEWPELPSLPELTVQLPDLPHLQVETPERIAIDNRPPLQAASGGDVHITIEGGINVHAGPGMDEQTLARMVNAEVRRAIADAGREAAARRRSAMWDLD